MSFQSIAPFVWNQNFLDPLAHRWALLTAGTEEQANTMTVSWGGIGVLWNKPVCFVFVRPQRYTKKWMDECNTFSLSFLPDTEEARAALTLCGKISGRDADKFSEAHLQKSFVGECPVIGNAETVLVCKKLYAQDMKADCFVLPEVREKNYPKEDYHTVYVGEILEVLQKTAE